MGFYQNHVVPYLVSLAMWKRELAPYRERIIGLAQGRVLEIGVGSGLNLPLYTVNATEVLGLDPHPRLLKMASEYIGRSEACRGFGGINSSGKPTASIRDLDAVHDS